ncbi:unnamed protein product, partial [Sphenostylis stenocarpa]
VLCEEGLTLAWESLLVPSKIHAYQPTREGKQTRKQRVVSILLDLPEYSKMEKEAVEGGNIRAGEEGKKRRRCAS